ncbi:ABC transporter substrate-binding protein [Marinobacterium jannaschii]|uniref:ABC transporter substrate-binding protein n=1 Tax=Marinobacterium jannaschii TaxID=64970 RepID=UPI00048A0CBB|nr:ABC transporter substrate-binding protein [Marinobacterium jannaschii]
MKYRYGFIALSLAGLVAGAAQANSISVVSFGGATQDAQREVFYQPFSRETGVDITEVAYNGGLAEIESMIDQQQVRWDVVQVEDPDLVSGCKKGYFQRLDWQKLGGPHQYLPSGVSDCGVGHIIWSSVITYDKNRLSSGPKNWVDFWDIQRFAGTRALRKGPRGNLEFALMADGVPPEKVYVYLETRTGQDRAFRKLKELKPYIRWWESASLPTEWVANGEVAMATAYNGRISNANKEGANLAIVWDGQMFSVDSWVIVSGSPNASKAMEFITYASSAEASSKFPAAMPYGVTNRAAIRAIPESLALSLPTHPSNTVHSLREDSQFWLDHSDQLSQRFERWLAD